MHVQVKASEVLTYGGTPVAYTLSPTETVSICITLVLFTAILCIILLFNCIQKKIYAGVIHLLNYNIVIIMI